MQRILGYLRKACQEFDLIENGDKIAVCVSGGKDSLVMLCAMSAMRRFYEKKYDIICLTIDPRFGGKAADYSPLEKLCGELGVDFETVSTNIGEIVFDIRKEKNPCSLCANMRRGALNGAAKDLGCNKIALGHNNDDVIQTFVMNLFQEGRLGCFAPKTYLSRSDITVIRPLVFAPEYAVVSCAERNKLPVIKSNCPADKHTLRQTVKDSLNHLEYEHRGVKERIFGALRKSGLDRWGYKNE